jgi:hypothetical protein
MFTTGLGALAAPALAHNNPTFREEWFATLEVASEPLADGFHTALFALDPPKRTIEIVWRVAAGGPAGVTFSLVRNGEVVAADLQDGAVSRAFRGDGFVIAQVANAPAPFALELYASLAEWQKSS